MSSVQSYFDQQNTLWAGIPDASGLTNLRLAVYDSSNNNFQTLVDISGRFSSLVVFRDLGVVQTSAGRTFREIQMLTAGVPATFGVTGVPAGSLRAGPYKTFYYENSIENGLARTSPLFRIR